jgi:hypothetical protein
MVEGTEQILWSATKPGTVTVRHSNRPTRLYVEV